MNQVDHRASWYRRVWGSTRRLLLGVAGLVFGLTRCTTVSTFSELYDNPRADRLDNAVHDAVTSIRRTRTPGIAIGIVTTDGTKSYGYGEVRRGSGVVPNRHTIFEIGSISKTFTALLWAYEALDDPTVLETPIDRLASVEIPRLQRDNRAVRLIHLLNHTSGLPRDPYDIHQGIEVSQPYRHYGDERLLAFLPEARLSWKPGTHYEYSNVGFGVAGIVLEERTGLSYELLVAHRIAEPLGMVDTGIHLTADQAARFATGYDRRGRQTPPWDEMGATRFAGGLRSTVDDMLRYAEAQLSASDGTDELDRAMALTQEVSFVSDKPPLALGLAWAVLETDREHAPLYVHDGGTGGFMSYLAFSREERFAVVLLTNGHDRGPTMMRLLQKIVMETRSLNDPEVSGEAIGE